MERNSITKKQKRNGYNKRTQTTDLHSMYICLQPLNNVPNPWLKSKELKVDNKEKKKYQ